MSERRIDISSPEINVDDVLTQIEESIRKGQIAQGPRVAEAENLLTESFHADHASALANGTASLRAALIASVAVKHGINKQYIDRTIPGGEVIMPAFSFNATLNTALQAGATARLVDIRADDFGIDPEAVHANMNEKTLAVMPVDLYGQAADISSQDSRYADIAVVRDSAQAHGARLNGEPIVSHGDSVSLSFYPTKNISAPEGGAVLTNNPLIDSIVRIYRGQGMAQRYIYEMSGDNLRMTDIHAAFLIASLKGLERVTARRRENAAYLTECLSGIEGITLPVELEGRRHVWHQYTILVDPDHFGMDRNDLQQCLSKYNIGSGVYYPTTMDDHDTFRDHPRIIKEPTPIADNVSQKVLSLPVHPRVSSEDIERIAETIKAIQAQKVGV